MLGLYDKWLSLKGDEDRSTIYHFYEGDGSNLSLEDEEQGCVDYFIYDKYCFDKKENAWKELDGGMILTKKPISDMTDAEKLACLDGMEFDFVDGKPAGIITPNTIVELDPSAIFGLNI